MTKKPGPAIAAAQASIHTLEAHLEAERQRMARKLMDLARTHFQVRTCQIEIDGRLSPDARAQEDGQQFGVGEGAGTAGQEFLPRTLVRRPVCDCHGVKSLFMIA